jgi:ribosomal peptide maturation radical SAM protein 1
VHSVVLVNMPFGSFRQPSLALGLLKATLASPDLHVKVLDATVDFAALVSPKVYDEVTSWPAVDLLGDRIFAEALPTPPRRTLEEYAARILAGGSPEHDIPHFGKKPLDGGMLDDLRTAAEKVPAFLDSCLEEILSDDPLLVGFTSMSGQHAASLALAARLKEAQEDATIVFGGASCRGVMGEALLQWFPFVDAVAGGEGEAVLPEVVRRRVAGRPLAGAPGLLTRADVDGPAARRAAAEPPPPADLDRLSAPDYDEYFARLAAGSLSDAVTPRLPFEGSRGCWWGEKSRCSFCGQASESMTYRVKSPEGALQGLAELVRRHGPHAVFMTDEILPPAYFSEFFPRVQERVPGVRFVYAQARPDLTREQLAGIFAAGVRRLEVGIESLSTPVLALMGKGTTALRCVQLLKWAREIGLTVVWNFLWGVPGEPVEDYERMARLVPLLSHLEPPNTVGAVRIDRCSPLFEDPGRYGLTDARPYPAYGYVYDLPPAALDGLAYFFHARPKTPQPVERYTAPLAARIEEWKAVHRHSFLSSIDDGAELTLTDGRPGFDRDELTVLDGEHRLLYRTCERVTTTRTLASLLTRERNARVDDADIEVLLRPLVEQGLMLQEGRAYLSLGVAADPARGEPAPAGPEPAP